MNVKNNKLSEYQRQTIETLSKNNELLANENRDLKKQIADLNDKALYLEHLHDVALAEYNSSIEEAKSMALKMREAMKSFAKEKKQYEKQMRSLFKNINSSYKNIKVFCSVCGNELTEDYLYKDGRYICIHCHDDGVD